MSEMNERSDYSSNYKVWDLPVRLFHWSLALLVLLLWLTGEFGGMDVTVSLPFKGETYFSNMDIHALAGQGVFVLVVFRLLWGIWGSTTARFSHFVHRPSTVFAKLSELLKGGLSVTVGHNPLGGAMVVALLLLLAAQSVTGLFSADDFFFEGPLAHLVSEKSVKTISEIHHLIFSILEVLIILHLLAIIFYRLRGHDLVRAMFTGRRDIDASSGPQSESLNFAPAWLALVSILCAAAALLILRAL